MWARRAWSSLAVAGTAWGAGELDERRHRVAQADGAAAPGSDARVFTKAEVAEHTTADKGIWVTYKEGVYDITSFIKNHPGGQDKIVLAAGQSVEPFWRIYQQHYNSKLPLELLAPLRVGTLDPSEAREEVDSSDPYSTDPERHPALTFHNKKPCNAELPATLQLQDWRTPAPLWFIRHHHPVPDLDAATHTLSLGGNGVDEPLVLDMDLLKCLPKAQIDATIQCGGNRRSGLNPFGKTSGIAWGTGAISNASWGGARLSDLLNLVGICSPEDAEEHGIKHVIFLATDGLQASIPIEKALNPFGDVLVAWEMNGEPLPREHGFPLRVVVPGVVGVRNVKWVNEIRLSSEEAEGTWQRGISYKGFPPHIKDFKNVDVAAVQSMQDLPVQSAIASPLPGATVLVDGEDDIVTVEGWAYSGGGRGIVRVDVSYDGGKNWYVAELGEGKDQNPMRSWAWTFWSIDLPLPPDVASRDSVEVCCRATDATYGTQPERPEPIWNIRGLNNVSWHTVKLNLQRTPEEDEAA